MSEKNGVDETVEDAFLPNKNPKNEINARDVSSQLIERNVVGRVKRETFLWSIVEYKVPFWHQ